MQYATIEKVQHYSAYGSNVKTVQVSPASSDILGNIIEVKGYVTLM